MCGILLVRSQHQIPLAKHLAALETIKSRGPDFSTYHYTDHTFIAQTVLHITGSDSFYHTHRNDFFAFNGEIYNYRQFGPAASDIDAAYRAARDDVNRFKDFTGPWAWALYNNGSFTYATDPQGERVLYQYQDQDILIVASEVTAILAYIQTQTEAVPYVNKCWTMLHQTPWRGIERITPGQLYRDGTAQIVIDSVWSWIQPTTMSMAEAQEEFDLTWRQVIDEIQPQCAASLSYSAGIDSTMIMDALPALDLIAVNITNKDPVVTHAKEYLSSSQLTSLAMIDIDPEHWASLYQELICSTRMPAQSWSFVGKWAVAKACSTRVLFTGLAADELFGGYDVYHDLVYDQHGSHSPYSSHDHDQLWSQCLDSYHGDARQATLLMDYWYQVVGMDAPGQDRIAGAWGIEVRNPFMHQRVMKFALNLPWQLKVGVETKPLLKHQWRRNRPNSEILPKMGFAGHANDSAAWLPVHIVPTGNRHQDWIQIAQQTFYHYCEKP
jgi:asparagine synthetase B (glutamine-hydrolysing)